MSKAGERQLGVMETTVNGVMYEEVVTSQSQLKIALNECRFSHPKLSDSLNFIYPTSCVYLRRGKTLCTRNDIHPQAAFATL